MLVCLGFLMLVGIIYWLTEKPKREPRSQYTLPTSSSSKARVYERPLSNPPTSIYYKPPKILAVIEKPGNVEEKD